LRVRVARRLLALTRSDNRRIDRIRGTSQPHARTLRAALRDSAVCHVSVSLLGALPSKMPSRRRAATIPVFLPAVVALVAVSAFLARFNYVAVAGVQPIGIATHDATLLDRATLTTQAESYARARGGDALQPAVFKALVELVRLCWKEAPGVFRDARR